MATLPLSSNEAPPPPPPNTVVAPSPVTPAPAAKTPARGGGKKILLFLLIILLLVAGISGAIYFYRAAGPGRSATLTYWGLWEPESVMRPILDEYVAQNKHLTINYEMQSISEYRERLESRLSQGTGPDLFRIHNTWVPMFRSHLAPVPADIYSASAYTSTFYPAASQSLRVGTNYFAVPLEFDGLAMYVNDDLLSQTGHPVPKTWEDLRTTAMAMAKCEDPKIEGLVECKPGLRIQVAGVALGSTDNVDHWQDILSVLMLQNGVNLVSPQGKALDDSLKYFTDFAKVQHVWDSTLPASTVHFANGRVGMYFGPSWRVFDIKKQNPNLKFSTHPIPQLPIDPIRGEQPITWASFWVEGVNKNGKNAEEAWKLLKYLSSAEVMQKLYKSAQTAAGREFGEPYSRRDLAGELRDHPYVGAFIRQAETAQSWYLASATYDGRTGINTQLSDLFRSYMSGTMDINELSNQVNKVLSGYGLASPAP